MAYSPQLFEPLTFFDMTPRFRDGRDTPRASPHGGEERVDIGAWIHLHLELLE